MIMVTKVSETVSLHLQLTDYYPVLHVCICVCVCVCVCVICWHVENLHSHCI